MKKRLATCNLPFHIQETIILGITDYGAFVIAIIVFLAIPGPGNLALITSTSKGGIRGGLAATLNEIAGQSGVGMMLYEERIPVKPVVAAACEFLGLDPLYVANEGKLIAICSALDAELLLNAMRAHPLGRDACFIGDVVADDHHFVQLTTAFGGRRIVDWLAGDQLPRIC